MGIVYSMRSWAPEQLCWEILLYLSLAARAPAPPDRTVGMTPLGYQ